MRELHEKHDRGVCECRLHTALRALEAAVAVATNELLEKPRPTSRTSDLPLGSVTIREPTPPSFVVDDEPCGFPGCRKDAAEGGRCAEHRGLRRVFTPGRGRP